MSARPSFGFSLFTASRLCGNRFSSLHINRRQPAEAVWLQAVGDGEELLTELARNFAWLAVGHQDLVDRADRLYFGGCAGKEHFVGYVKHFARNGLLGYGKAQVPGDGQHRIARNAAQRRVGQGRRVDDAVACLLYTSPSPRDRQKSRMPSSA